MIKLSFCIPVYNQIEMTRRCIESIIEYTGNDIEVIVSDDCSSEDIETLIKQFGDDRIHYYRNKQNLGHDLNIIASFQKACGEFVFLLRTRDLMINQAIPDIINLIKDKKEIAYITGSAKDEKGNLVIDYKRTNYSEGKDALVAHTNLYIHPSGSAYNRSYIDFEYMERFIRDKIDTKFSFIVHDLLRMQLSQKGNFEIITKPIWIYTNTSRSSDVAVNSTKNRESVYSSDLCSNRYIAEMIWCKEVVSPELRLVCYRFLFREYLKQCTWILKLRNIDKNMRKHYNYKKIKISVKHERSKFLVLTNGLEDLILDEKEKYDFDNMVKDCVKYNKTIGKAKYYILLLVYYLKLDRLLDEVINRIRYIRRLK